MNKIKSVTAGALSLAAITATAAPFLEVGDNAALFLLGTVGVQHNDNVSLTEDGSEDSILEFAPGLSFEFGQNALTSGAITYVETITRYDSNDQLDAELSSIDANASYAEGKTLFAFRANWSQLNQNTVDTRVINRGTLSRRDVTSIGADGEWEMTMKTSAGLGADFHKVDYKTTGFIDSERIQIPVNLYYELTPKVDLSLGARWRQTELDAPGVDSDDMFYSIGARGEFSPKFTGSFRIGYNQRDDDLGRDRNTLGLESAFSYYYSEKTSFSFSIGNDFGYAATGESQENFDISFGAQTRLTPYIGVSGRIYYRDIDYFSRPDDRYIEGHIDADYSVNEYLTLVAGLVLRNNDSELARGDFDNTVLRLAARVRY